MASRGSVISKSRSLSARANVTPPPYDSSRRPPAPCFTHARALIVVTCTSDVLTNEKSGIGIPGGTSDGRAEIRGSNSTEWRLSISPVLPISSATPQRSPMARPTPTVKPIDSPPMSDRSIAGSGSDSVRAKRATSPVSDALIVVLWAKAGAAANRNKVNIAKHVERIRPLNRAGGTRRCNGDATVADAIGPATDHV
jgi:hypothetical protein